MASVSFPFSPLFIYSTNLFCNRLYRPKQWHHYSENGTNNEKRVWFSVHPQSAPVRDVRGERRGREPKCGFVFSRGPCGLLLTAGPSTYEVRMCVRVKSNLNSGRHLFYLQFSWFMMFSIRARWPRSIRLRFKLQFWYWTNQIIKL